MVIYRLLFYYSPMQGNVLFSKEKDIPLIIESE